MEEAPITLLCSLADWCRDVFPTQSSWQDFIAQSTSPTPAHSSAHRPLCPTPLNDFTWAHHTSQSGWEESLHLRSLSSFVVDKRRQPLFQTCNGNVYMTTCDIRVSIKCPARECESLMSLWCLQAFYTKETIHKSKHEHVTWAHVISTIICHLFPRLIEESVNFCSQHN